MGMLRTQFVSGYGHDHAPCMQNLWAGPLRGWAGRPEPLEVRGNSRKTLNGIVALRRKAAGA